MLQGAKAANIKALEDMRHIGSRKRKKLSSIAENVEEENVIVIDIIIEEYVTQYDASENVTEAYINKNIIEEYVTQLNMMFMKRSLKI